MKIIQKAACIGVALAWSLGNVQATLVTFDDLGLAPLGDVTTQYAPVGVTFQGITDAGGLVNLEVADSSVFSDNIPTSLPFSLSNFYNNDPLSRAHIMQIMFSGGASGISFQYNGAGGLGSSTLFNIYNTSGILINSLTAAAATDSSFHLVSVADLNVGRIDIVNPTSGWGHYIDDLSFNVTSVPDAGSTSALMVIALGAFSVARRKLG